MEGCYANSLSFTDFPEDVQLVILSFLTQSDLSAFTTTSKRFASILHPSNTKLWYTLCDRRWGDKTQLQKWSNNGQISYKLVYRTLNQWDHLIGFWRRSGHLPGSPTNKKINMIESQPLIFFEWGSGFIIGNRVFPSLSRSGDYGVVKTPFLWLGLMGGREIVNILDPEGQFAGTPLDSFEDEEMLYAKVSFMGNHHIVIEEDLSHFFVKNNNKEDKLNGDVNARDKEVMSDIYQYFANRISPVRDRANARKQRRRKRERKRWEADHFVKIVGSSPTPSRPLQGLWKGICDDMSLNLYLVTYNEMGGLTCRRIGDSCQAFLDYSPVFWTPSTMLIEPPFSPEEGFIYDSRRHVRPSEAALHSSGKFFLPENEVVSRILFINRSHDLVFPYLSASVNNQNVEGRIWLYENGTFGFGFLGDDFIIDLKHIAMNGRLLDTQAREDEMTQLQQSP